MSTGEQESVLVLIVKSVKPSDIHLRGNIFKFFSVWQVMMNAVQNMRPRFSSKVGHDAAKVSHGAKK
jgi:hypothetical protein